METAKIINSNLYGMHYNEWNESDLNMLKKSILNNVELNIETRQE